MKTELITITPKMAQQWLAAVDPEKQRTLRNVVVDQYATSMRLGHWIVTHQGIAFDIDGNLCDGQHRIAAIVASGVSVKMMVTRDMPTLQGALFTFDAIDRGSIRGIGQQIQIRHGVKDANRVTAGARIIAQICTRVSVKMTVATTLAVLDRFGDQLTFVNKEMQTTGLQTASSLGSLAFCLRVAPKELSEFVSRTGDGDGIGKGNPAHTLRNHMLTNRPRCGTLAGHERACALCAMHYMLANKITQIKRSNAGLDFFRDKQPRIVDEVSALF